MQLSTKGFAFGISMWLGLPTEWELDFKRRCPNREYSKRPRRSCKSSSVSAPEEMQHPFRFNRLITGESLRPVQIE